MTNSDTTAMSLLRDIRDRGPFAFPGRERIDAIDAYLRTPQQADGQRGDGIVLAAYLPYIRHKEVCPRDRDLANRCECGLDALADTRVLNAAPSAGDALREFPMLDGPSIPWSVAETVYERYKSRGGVIEQSLERIAQRGGFGWGEVADMWKRKPRRAALPESTKGEKE
jgi:hypothetical protein